MKEMKGESKGHERDIKGKEHQETTAIRQRRKHDKSPRREMKGLRGNGNRRGNEWEMKRQLSGIVKGQ